LNTSLNKMSVKNIRPAMLSATESDSVISQSIFNFDDFLLRHQATLIEISRLLCLGVLLDECRCRSLDRSNFEIK
jgi:hypothetical protein